VDSSCPITSSYIGPSKAVQAGPIHPRSLSSPPNIRLFTPPLTDLVQRLQAARRDLRLPQELAKLDRFDLLILDDVSYVGVNPTFVSPAAICESVLSASHHVVSCGLRSKVHAEHRAAYDAYELTSRPTKDFPGDRPDAGT
jgi:hypothetical protein